MKIKRDEEFILGFNFASLTDIVLMLLIFFMLSSSFIIQDGFKLKLPKSQTAETHNRRSITVTIDNAGRYFLNSRKTEKENLGPELRRILLRSPESVVVIRASRNLAVQKVVDVMDLAKAAGAGKFLIATENDI
jgi:biopolymer transport protein ExbD